MRRYTLTGLGRSATWHKAAGLGRGGDIFSREGYILTIDQSDAGSVWVYSHDGRQTRPIVLARASVGVKSTRGHRGRGTYTSGNGSVVP
eukprot:1181903-Prorocentrum_minimum.AAC.3